MSILSQASEVPASHFFQALLTPLKKCDWIFSREAGLVKDPFEF